ncbi:MAG: hypothetical protein E7301_08075 [Butyrivibrio sp.]|nr:hypothetical protein [Butyrivibrio sp.]
MMPDWVLKHKKPGTTIKKIGNNYYLYYATSSRLPDKKYPVSAQSYIGKITEQGIISDKVSITVKDTEALPIIDIFPELDARFSKVIALHIKNKWLLTKTDKSLADILEQKGLCKNGEIVF